MLEVALDCIRRGWYVFPCFPRSKKPATNNGFKSATLDEATVRAWWKTNPEYNVAIATGPSGLCVVDIDHGHTPDTALPDGLAKTYTVHTGRRPEYGIQLYYAGEGLKSTGWQRDGLSGDIRCSTGYVIAAGSIHPDSGEAYKALYDDGLLSPVPDYVRALTIKANDPSVATTIDDATAEDWKTWLLEYMDRNKLEPRDYEKRVSNGYWLGIVCPWLAEHGSGAGAESSTVLGVLDGKLAFECSHGTCKANKHDTAAFREAVEDQDSLEIEPGADLDVILGSALPMPKAKPDPSKWRDLFHTKDEVLNCPPPTFLIQDFLAKQAICAIAAPVAQRKSLIALNVARSLCTGEPLFGFLPVLNQPSRVLYLCPEMGLVSLSDRIRKIGLGDALGDSLFIRSMNLGNIDLPDLPDEALLGSVLIVDTAIRFMKGDENSAKDMQCFSEVLFNTQRRQGPDGAILVLYHSPKATKDASELTLENCMRGSGELGAAITDAHGTRLQDPADPYKSGSFLRHIKCRDYQGVEDFEMNCNLETGVLLKTGEAGVKAVLSVKNGGFRGDKDGMDEAAKTLIKGNMDLSIRDSVKLLNDASIKRSKSWVSNVKIGLKGDGSNVTESPKVSSTT